MMHILNAILMFACTIVALTAGNLPAALGWGVALMWFLTAQGYQKVIYDLQA